MKSQQGVRRDSADVGRNRERRRQRRLLRIAVVLGPVAGYLWYRILTGDPVSAADVALPVVDPLYVIIGLFFLVMIGVLLAQVVVSGRSPHVVYRPEQIDVSMDDVKGLGPVKEEVQRSLDLFLAGRTFRRDMGGTPRRGLLFEGPPGTGKTHMAKAMAREAGVPFLYVSGTSFQSMYYGATARKIRSYFRALRKAARAEGGAIGFIEEIDAIATVRHGMPMAPAAPVSSSSVVCCGGLEGLPMQSSRATTVSAMTTEGVGGVVNELLVQMQSFDEPTGAQQLVGRLVDAVNLLLPAHRQLPRPRVEPVDVLLIAATNRADSLDPALLRPGRFDRRLTFDAPDQRGRREVLDHFLARKAHEAELDDDERRDALAGITAGSTPVMIENLLDEALVNAVRRGASAMNWKDVEHARLVTSVGLGSPVGYTDREARLIATHEAGHAVVAHLVAPQRRLEVLTIIKRAGALGLLAHGDAEEVWTRSRSELVSLVQIAFGGQVAEELAFGDVSTGPSSDLAYATRIGAQMVGSAGMAGTLVSFAAAEASPVGEGLVGRVLGDSSTRAQLEQLLGEQRDAVRALLGANTHLVAALRDALLERHELIGHEITDVLAAAGPAVEISGVSAAPRGAAVVVLPGTGSASAPTVGA
ncbi:ATP-dependent Zn proteases [Quadrisphaera granulorum]|uniref:ATP-dependent Zn protease n=1 Tax=Quadrisphaera granulorum TaxID=317664 RepID=A0A316AGV4_9ACTN|nr:AAA family ATPase [Quadrisphaera granulorum]PWJ56170.1 ATP-dependent Zn protease [Quadrisphaera granulorum]SZE94804.1 ATP-dependent Zn proteases [Quadrisphaera granulorum]